MFSKPTPPVSSQHFLVVEPDPLFRLLLCVALSGQFSDYSAVASFGEARALVAEHSFAVIVAEYHLPGGTGLALYEAARAETPAVPFVLMCGGMRVELPDPHYCFLAKPFSLAELNVAVERLVARACRS